MIDDFHHTPGRLRVRTPLVRGDRAKGGKLRGHLYGLAGVKAVRVSEVTGSITVHYDGSRLALPHLLERLETGGVAGATKLAQTAGDQCPLTQIAEWTGRVALGMAVEQLLQRSAMALIVSLL